MFLFTLFACATTPQPPAVPIARQTSNDLRAELATEGSIQDRLAVTDQADLVIYYAGEQQGSLAPCGCPSRPRGGLPRMASYLEQSSPGIIVNGGHWLDDGLSLDGQPRADVPLKNQWMVRGLQQMNMAAINVGIHDITGISSLESGPPELPLVSSNIVGPGIQTHIVIEHQNQRIGITGISNPGHTVIKTPGYTRADPVSSAMDVISTIDADVIILLSYLAPEAAKKLAKKGLVDVVIDTGKHRTFDPPFRVNDAIWVRSHFQTMRLGELRLGVDDSRIQWALDRKIDLDDSLPNQADQSTLAQEAEKALGVLEKELFGR
ncbi:MAG: hypothetical protein ACPGTU_04255 [Myxococcota bacterium]